MNNSFNILSIDGGGIRGVFPAKFLVLLETELEQRKNERKAIHEHFDLICGTSTGGIIALALALDIPAKRIHELYLDHAKDIFGGKRNLVGRFRKSSHSRDKLEALVREIFRNPETGDDYRLDDCKTNVCIPIYDLLDGKPSVCKNNYHPRFTRDYHLPVYQVALATSAAPTYFDPYSAEYTDLSANHQLFSNKVDGGVFVNNPTLLGIIEAQEAFNKNLGSLKVLSLGTGHQKFSDSRSSGGWGIHYWMLKNRRQRLIDLFVQGQSQMVENIVRLMQNGIDRQRIENPSFIYQRITTELDGDLALAMDETNLMKLERLSERAAKEFHNHSNWIINTYCN